MSDDIKHISVKEFRELGFIQEINRLILHPCGLALSVQIDLDDDTVPVTFAPIWDFRDDPEGLAFADEVLDVEKVKSVDTLYHSKDDVRTENFGWVIQPVPEEAAE